MSRAEVIDLEDRQKFLPDNDPVSIQYSSDLKEDKQNAFGGLTKDQIMQYANDPTWVRIRWFLFILFWVVWVGMLAAAVLIVINTPKCPHRPKLSWWEKDVVYQVDVEYFKDSNGDGIGDIDGVTSKLDYLSRVGFKTLNLNQKVIDTESTTIKVKEAHGNEADLKELRKKLDDLDMHVILDIPIGYLATNDLEKINFWLTNYVDGIRILTAGETNLRKLEEWTTLTNDIAAKIFKPRYISFYPLKRDSTIKFKPSTFINDNLLNINPETIQSKPNFISLLNGMYNSSSTDLESFIVNYYGKSRVSTLIKDQFLIPIYHSLVLLMRGTPYVLYGDELNFDETNKYMQWDMSTTSCGFSNVSVIPPTICDKTVRESEAIGADKPLISIYSKLIQLRQEPSLSWGKIKLDQNSGENVISFVRVADGFPGYLIAANTDKNNILIDFQSRHEIPKEGKVVFFNSISGTQSSEFQVDKTIPTNNIKLRYGDLLVLQFD